MEISLSAIPSKVENAFASYIENDDGSMDVTASRHPGIKSFHMSKVGKYIFERCNGANTVSDIADSVFNDYKDVSLDTVKNDLFNILFSFWRIGFISWDKNPYDYFYNSEHEGLEFRILTEDETAVILSKVKEVIEPNYDVVYDKRYALNENRIKQSIYLGSEQYSYVIENNNLKCLICIKSDNIKKTSLDIVLLYVSDDFHDKTNELQRFITWSAERFAKASTKDFYRINNHSLAKTPWGKVLDSIGFEKIGLLKNAMTFNNEKDSIIVKSLKLPPCKLEY